MKIQFLSKYAKYLIAFVGILSSLIGIMQFYSLNTYPVISGEFCLDNNTSKGRLIEFVHKVTKNSGELLYFDDVIIQSNCVESTLHYEDESYVLREWGDITSVVYETNEENGFTYAFNFRGFIKSVNTETEEGLLMASKSLLESHKIKYSDEDIEFFELMWFLDMSGYNVHISFNSDNMSQNQYSAINGVQEGSAILVRGPFQIKDESGGEHVRHVLSAPVIDSSAKKQIECTKKDWGKFRKALFCPFL